ncbi:Carbohydrate binding module (family 6) [Pseudobutyrivibrio sp. OR37]|uniref:carbohydrate-binding protein n=1 Tax=Pseudobutyrivibrio sp. OR37 TaxID=1798186 RepID=UPI0008DFC6F2|nr:carbohydrate-binding protein [Pseudobutyrivibrio sp. OR37]SFH68802.1 Carbohydrate binding module (family 6) [Pseudobutyrivibrio sp. OR37]
MRRIHKSLLSASLALGLMASSVTSLTAFAVPKISPYSTLEAEMTATKNGVDVTTEGDLKYVSGLESGDTFSTVPLEFTSGVVSLTANVRTNAPSLFEVRLDKADGDLISTFRVGNTHGAFKQVSASAKQVEGHHTLYFVGKVGATDIDNWKALLPPGQQPVTPEPTPTEPTDPSNPTPADPSILTGTVNPYETVEGENSQEMKAAVAITVDNTRCAMIRSNGYAAVKNVDFTDGLAVFIVTAKASKLGVLEIRLDSPEGQLISNVKLNAGDFSTKTVKVASGIEGKHDLYFVATFKGATVYLDSWKVMAPPTKPEPTPVDPTPVDPTPVDPTPVDPTPVDPTPAQSDLSLQYEINSWGAGYTVNFKVVNNSTTQVNGWTLKIKKSDITVDNCWCAKVAEEGEYYVFTPETWNSMINANGNATFGLNGSGSIGNTLNFILL